MIREGTTKRVVGRNLFGNVARTLVQDVSEVFLELMSNGYDADAENMSFSTDPALETLVIEDDGTGMDEAGIENFLRVGDSNKVDKAVTGKGRTPIGKFGIATILLEYLGDSFELETYQNGQKLTLSRNFKTDDDALLETGHTNKMKRGTKITVRGFSPSKGFSLKKLQKELEWKSPLVPDFTMRLNGVEIEKRYSLSNCRRYDFHTDLGEIGEISGSFFYSPKGPVPSPGVYFHVNGRAVGDPSAIDLKQLSRSFERRMYARIDAPQLEPLIRFNRKNITTDDAVYQAILEETQTVLRSIRYDVENDSRLSKGPDKRATMARNALSNAEERINANLAERLGSTVKLEWVDDESIPVSFYDPLQQMIYLNSENPSVHLPKNPGRNEVRALETKAIHLSLSAIAEHELIVSGQVQSDAFSDFHQEILSIGSSYSDEKRFSFSNTLQAASKRKKLVRVSPDDIVLNDYRLYEFHEVGQKVGMDLNSVKLLYLAGSLETSCDGEALFGKDNIVSSMRQIEGYVPVSRVLDPVAYNTPITGRLSTDALYRRDSPFIQYFERDGVINVGNDVNTFLWINNEFAESFKAEVLSGRK